MPYKSNAYARKYYRDNPEQAKKKSEATAIRNKAKREGKDVAGKDYDHRTDKFIETSKNRSNPTEQKNKRKRKPDKEVSREEGMGAVAQRRRNNARSAKK